MAKYKDGRTRKPHQYTLDPEVEDYLAWIKYKVGTPISRQIDNAVKETDGFKEWKKGRE